MGNAQPRTPRKRSLRDLDLRGKRVLLRADFNVPLQAGRVTDDARIRGALPTIQYLLEQEAAIVACSHLGRPKGHVHDDLRLAPVATALAQALQRPVAMAPDCVGPAVQQQARALRGGQVLLLENLRFHPEEEANDPVFARALAGLAEVYVNDAFGAAHRAHASTEGVALHLPAAAGLLMQRELDSLANVLMDGGRVAVVSGGAKVSGKLGLLHTLVERAAVLCIGGAMANTFLLASGHDVGASLAEPGMTGETRAIEAEAAAHGCQIVLPVDAVIAQDPDQRARARPLLFDEEPVPPDWRILDVGPRTVENFEVALASADTVIWNGPLGLFEREAFAGGTRTLAQMLARLDARTIVAGGETLAAVHRAGVAERMTHCSTGGAAALELLQGRVLPGLAALPNAG